jgi:hypothetical protein
MRSGRNPATYKILLLAAALGALCACAPSGLETTAAIKVRTRGYLDSRDCTNAIIAIEGLYNSGYADNEVRLLRASAHGCAAGIEDFTTFLLTLGTSNIVGGALWQTLSEMFYVSSADETARRISSSYNAIDALHASIRPGVYPLSIDYVNAGTENVGSVRIADRTDAANQYLTFVAMASIGNLQNYYGAPDTSYQQGQNLGATGSNPNGWSVATAVRSSTDPSGCSYAAAVLNMLDGISASANDLPESISESLLDIESQFSEALGQACMAGCAGSGGGPVTVSGYAMTPRSGCAFADPTDCQTQGGRPCPRKLRDKMSCTGTITNESSCAAAGLVQFINEHPILGWQGP